MTYYPPENTNIDRGNSRGQYWYSMVDTKVISTTSIVNTFLLYRLSFLMVDNYCDNSFQHHIPLKQKSRVDVDVTTGDITKT